MSAKVRLWTGYAFTAIPVLMLTFSGVMKLVRPEGVVTEFIRLGYPETVIAILGVVELACAALYLFPRTSVLGAILIAAYLGGATATHVRVGDLAFFMPPLLGAMAWGGLYLRDERLRALIPLKS
jgi:hypothetical protein